MNWLKTHRAIRRHLRQEHIAQLERQVGLEISHPPDVGLPVVKIVRNPEGEWFMADRWKAEGFPGYRAVEAATKRGCLKKARRRLRAMVQAQIEPETLVKP